MTVVDILSLAEQVNLQLVGIMATIAGFAIGYEITKRLIKQNGGDND